MKKLSKILLLTLALVMLLPAVSAFAATPYQTHTFMASEKEALYSPDA